jgi:hypothetical protein
MWLKTLGTTAVVIGIALGGTAYAASSQTGNAAYCWQRAGDALDCKYLNMAACTKAAGSASECVQNPQRTTTGSGMKSGHGMQKSK